MALNGLQMPFSALQGISDLHHVGLDGTEGEVLSRRHSRASYMANQSIYRVYKSEHICFALYTSYTWRKGHPEYRCETGLETAFSSISSHEFK